MKLSLRISLALPLLAVAIATLSYRFGRARADGIPTTTPLLYGGMLEDSGSPVQGTRTFTIRLWDSATGGSLACAETNAPNTPVQNGQWRVAVNPACVSAVQQNPNLWVETLVEGVSLGRSKIGAVPYAVEAGRAAAASGMLAMQIDALQNIAGRPVQQGPSLTISQPGRYLIVATASVTPGSCSGGNSGCSCAYSVSLGGVGTAALTYRSSPVSTYYYITTDRDNPFTYTRVGLLTVPSGMSRTLDVSVSGTTTSCSNARVVYSNIIAIPSA